MKPLSAQDHYETLEIPRDASPEDVERAYHLARATYAEGSLAGHSVFAEGDVQAIRERIEMAYQTLSDPELRAGYDAQLERQRERAPEAASLPDPEALAEAVSSAVETVESLESLELDEIDDEDGEFDGARLRRTRMRNGVDLDQIASVTKVNPTYLRFIEEERFDDLPAAVYVRGFVKGYASCVGLDPERVASSYMKRCERHHEGRPRPKSLFLRR